MLSPSRSLPSAAGSKSTVPGVLKFSEPSEPFDPLLNCADMAPAVSAIVIASLHEIRCIYLFSLPADFNLTNASDTPGPGFRGRRSHRIAGFHADLHLIQISGYVSNRKL